jgi:hypothetical protein
VQPIRVGLSALFGGLFFVVAVFNFYVYGITHDGMQLALGIMMGVIGLLYSFGTFLVVDARSVQIKNPLGITMKTHHFASPHDLTIEGKKLWVETANGRKKISGLVASGRDWAALADAIRAAQTSSPAPKA